jgi:hypothetical protein
LSCPSWRYTWPCTWHTHKLDVEGRTSQLQVGLQVGRRPSAKATGAGRASAARAALRLGLGLGLLSTVIPQPTSRACPHLNGTRRTAGRLLMLEFDADPDLKFNFPPSPVIPFACNCVLMSVVVSSTLPICDCCRQYLIASLTGAFFPRWKIQLTAEQHAVAGISGTDGIPKGVTTSATSPRVPFVLVSCLEPCICQLLHYPLVQACQIPHLDALFPLLVALSKAPRVRPHLRFHIPLNSLWVHSRCGTGGGVSFVSLLCPYHQRYYFRSLITP